MRLSVIGSGSWGTALAHHLARCGHDVVVWAREAEVVEGINGEHRNPLFLADLELHPELRAAGDLGEVARHSDVWVWVVPVQFSRGVMEEIRHHLRPEVVVVSASKGVETETLDRMDQIAADVMELPSTRFCALSGPTFARELVLGFPSLAVIACPALEVAADLQRELSDTHMRVYAGRDLVGVELAGALKNVVAIAAGVVDGLGLGSNTLAALMTRGLHEITRLGVRLGADASTFRGLAGMGDLVLTCTGALSRNRAVGKRIAQGETLEDIQASTREVAEGVRTAPAVQRLAGEVGVEMPITDAVVSLLSGEADARTMLDRLMTRELKVESTL